MRTGQHLPYGVYLERLRSLPVGEYLTPARGEPYPDGVAKAILLSVDAVDAANQTGLCRGILDVVALLSTADVSRALLHARHPQAGTRALAGAGGRPHRHARRAGIVRQRYAADFPAN